MSCSPTLLSDGMHLESEGSLSPQQQSARYGRYVDHETPSKIHEIPMPFPANQSVAFWDFLHTSFLPLLVCPCILMDGGQVRTFLNPLACKNISNVTNANAGTKKSRRAPTVQYRACAKRSCEMDTSKFWWNIECLSRCLPLQVFLSCCFVYNSLELL